MKESFPERGPEEIAYQGDIIEVVRQRVSFGEKEKVFEFARRAPGTRLIIESPQGGFLVTKEYRKELEDFDIRLPGGKVFDRLADYNEFLKNGGDILGEAEKAATREAREEVGILPSATEHLWTSKAGATVVWDLFYFLVKKYELAQGQDLELGENIEIVEVSAEELRTMCLDGRIQEDRSVAVILRYLENRKK